MNKTMNFFYLIRVHNLLIAFFVINATAYFLNQKILSFEVIRVCIVVLSFMASGYIVNDLQDIKIDVINKVNRPLARNALTVKKCKIFNWIFVLLGCYFSLYLNIIAMVVLYCVLLPMLYLYNFYLKKIPIIGNLIIAFLLSMVLIFTELSLNNTYLQTIMLSALSFGINLIREIIKDIKDYDGDKTFNIKTIPIQYGINKTILILKYLIIAFIILSLICLSSLQLIDLILLIILVEIPLLYSLFLLVKQPRKNTFYYLSSFYKTIIINGIFIVFFMKGL